MRTHRIPAAVFLASCGTLGAPSTGDRDLPVTNLGPYALVTPGQLPTGTTSLVRRPDGVNLEEPCVVTVGGHRELYVTVTTVAGVSTIGRAVEDAPFAFGEVTTVFAASQAWEHGNVRSPSVALAADGTRVLAYEADGAIGLAVSGDDGVFIARSEPIVRDADSAARLVQPAIARTADGGWWLAYARAGSLFVSRAPSLGAAWAPASDAPVLAPDTTGSDAGADAALGFESVALGDPAWVIETTSAGRTTWGLLYTAAGGGRYTQVGAAASFDGTVFARTGRPALVDAASSVRAGSFERIDARTAVLWVSNGADDSRKITAALGPSGARVRSPFDP